MVKKVLVIRLRRIGDSVLSTVICSTLRKNFPEVEIHYVLCDPIGSLYEGHPDIDRVISFSREEFTRKCLFFKKVYQLMRKERYDVIIDTRTTLKTLCFALFGLQTKYRIGTWKWYSLLLHNYRVKNQVDSSLDEVQRNLLLLRPLEKLTPIDYVVDFRLYPSQNEVSEFKSYMEQAGIDFKKPVMLCTPFTRVEGKAWNMDRMKTILNRILERYPVQMIFNYDRKEKKAAFDLYHAMGSPVQVFINVEADSLRKLVALLSLSNFFFGNEGGPRHMAQALQIPSFAIYPPWVDKRKWLPNAGISNQGVTPWEVIEDSNNMAETILFERLTVDEVWSRLVKMLDCYLC